VDGGWVWCASSQLYCWSVCGYLRVYVWGVVVVLFSSNELITTICEQGLCSTTTPGSMMYVAACFCVLYYWWRRTIRVRAEYPPTAPRLIGLTGFKGAGKDTAAELLFQYGFVKYSFAAPLKSVVAVAFGWDRRMLEGTTPASRQIRQTVDPYWSRILHDPTFTPVRALQIWGTNLIRSHVSPDFWVHRLMKQLDQLEGTARVICTDVRFPNEIAALRARGARIIRIERGCNPPWCDAVYADLENRDSILQNTENLPHESEWASVGLEDARVINNGTKAELLQALRTALVN